MAPNRFGALSFAIIATLACTQASASGFRISELSVAGLGQANAVVADDGPVGNYGYNMAGMGFHPGTRASLDVLAIKPSFEATNANGTFSSDNASEYLPRLYLTHRFQGNPLAVGIGINEPFGLKTSWPAGAFYASGPLSAFNAATPTLTDLRIIHVNPGLSYLVLPNLSLAAGLDYYRVTSGKLDTAGSTLEGSGNGYGFSVGALYSTERFNAGVQYRSRVNANLSGNSSVLGPATTTLNLPATLQAGVMYRFTPAWSAEFDLDWTGWSSFDQLAVQGGGTTVVNRYDWKNALAYRIGTAYRINNALTLRGGYSYDQTGQQDSGFSPRIPDANRHLLTLGMGMDTGPWTWDFGLGYALGASRTVSSTANPSPANPDLNGTTFYNGTYKSHALLYGISLSRAF